MCIMRLALRVGAEARYALLPPVQLAGVIRHLHVELHGEGEVVVPILPTAGITFFHSGGLAGESFSCGDKPFLAAPLRQPFGTVWLPETSFIAAHIYPQYLPRLFGLDAACMHNGPVALEDILPRADYGQLEEQIRRSRSSDEWVRLLCDWLGQRYASGIQSVPFSLKRELLHQNTADLAKLYNCSVRHLERMYKRAYGMTLRDSRRIERYSDAVSALLLTSPKRGDMVRIAVGAGYHDESHMIRDFRHYADTSPARFPEKTLLSQHRLYQYSGGTRAVALRRR